MYLPITQWLDQNPILFRVGVIGGETTWLLRVCIDKCSSSASSSSSSPCYSSPRAHLNMASRLLLLEELP
jgi:hypothetical protein